MSQTGSTRGCNELSGCYSLAVWVRVRFSNCTKAPGDKILWLTPYGLAVTLDVSHSSSTVKGFADNFNISACLYTST